MSFFQEYVQLYSDLIGSPIGWVFGVVFIGLLVYMLFWLKRDRAHDRYMSTIKWVFLEVRVDELNEKSPLAMEQVFAALHAVHQNFTWGEELAGRTVLYLSCEIVSLGGKVSYIFKLPAQFRNLLESAIFAQYPKAEIHEVEDYLRNLPHHYDPDTANFEFHGTQWLKKKYNAYPIRTYSQDASFEHSVQETIVDPLSNVLEVMSNLKPYELMAYQIVIRPVNDDWKDHTQHLVDELKGVPHKHEQSLWEKVLYFIPDILADILVTHALGVEKEEGHETRKQDDPPSQMLHKTDVEKMVINAIEHAKSKVSYEVKIRTLYLAPKGKFNKALRIPELVGAFRNFDDVNLNGIKPDIGHTWTEGPTYHFSERLEKPYIERAKLIRKRHFLHNFVPRSHWRGTGHVIMNTEELATIFHFPQSQYVRVSQVERTSGVKAAPPMNLPVK